MTVKSRNSSILGNSLTENPMLKSQSNSLVVLHEEEESYESDPDF